MVPRSFFALFLVCFASLGGVAAARTWTDASGDFKIEAELLRVSDDGASVTLRRNDGEEISLKIDSLCEADRKFIKERPKASESRGRDNPFLTNKERGTVAPSGKVNHRRALLIGVNEYRHFRKLEFCGTDVQALGQRLTAAGFDRDKVVVVHDAATRSLQPDKEKIVNQITLLLDSAAADDLIFLSFSGHGVRIGGKSYLVPYEGEMPESLKDEERLKSLISLDWLYEKLQACPAATKVFLVDACQNRLFSGDQRSARASVTPESIGQSLESAPRSVLLMTACAPGEVSHESSDLKHGVYTHFLLEALEGRADYNHDGIVSLKEANLYASEKTEQFVRSKFSETQRPSFKGEMQGDVPLAECLHMDRITVPDDIDKIEIAVQRIAEGGTITVKPGLYRYSGPLEITRDATILGSTGDPKDVTLESKGGNAIKMKAPRGRIQSVSLRNVDTTAPAVFVPEGRLELSKCDVTSEKGTAVSATGEKAEAVASHCTIHDAGRYGAYFVENAKGFVENCEIFANELANVCTGSGANPSMKGCKIHDGKKGGVFASKDGRGEFDQCLIFANALSGIEVYDSNPTFRNCKVYNQKTGGILVFNRGTGTFEDCESYQNTLSGMLVESGGNPVVNRCKFYDGKQDGVYVYGDGLGTFVGCEFYGNAFCGFETREGGNPTLKGCKVYAGKEFGIRVGVKGLGVFENCEVSGNTLSGVLVREGGNPTLKRCRVFDSKECGVYVCEMGQGKFEECDVYNNRLANVEVADNSNPAFNGGSIYGGKEFGLRVRTDSTGTFENCDIHGNTLAGVRVESGANPTVTGCKIHDGREGGIFIQGTTWGYFEDCDIYRNTLNGVETKEGANPTVKHCRVFNCLGGVLVNTGGHGLFENNSFSGNKNGAWVFDDDAGSIIRNGNSPNR